MTLKLLDLTKEDDTSTTAPTLAPRSEALSDTWYYPDTFASDLDGFDLSAKEKREAITCGWEWARNVISYHTDWDRFIAFTRILIISAIAEFRGNLVDVIASDRILGYDLGALLMTLCEGTPGHLGMVRECNAYLLFTSDKTSEQCSGELFRRYVNVLAQSPKQWFRMRDCDALLRFSIASALACNDLDIWFTEPQWEILGEIGVVLYDAVTFFKHRAEGETHNTFAYMPEDLRIQAFRQYREVLWALDAAWAHTPHGQIIVNTVRFAGGPVHMTMRRHRYVEEDLCIGRPETEQVISNARQNVKLWNRFEAKTIIESTQRYKDIIAQEHELMFPGLAESLEAGGDGHCATCHYRPSYGAKVAYQFGGVRLCDECRVKWGKYLQSIQERAAEVFPELRAVLIKAKERDHVMK